MGLFRRRRAPKITVEARVEIRPIHTKVVGVTFRNDDGSSRQRILKACREGEMLKLVKRPSGGDRNAVAVCRKNGQQLGNLRRELAAELAPLLDKGVELQAEITDLTGGGTFRKRTRGCNICITSK